MVTSFWETNKHFPIVPNADFTKVKNIHAFIIDNSHDC